MSKSYLKNEPKNLREWWYIFVAFLKRSTFVVLLNLEFALVAVFLVSDPWGGGDTDSRGSSLRGFSERIYNLDS